MYKLSQGLSIVIYAEADLTVFGLLLLPLYFVYMISYLIVNGISRISDFYKIQRILFNSYTCLHVYKVNVDKQ